MEQAVLTNDSGIKRPRQTFAGRDKPLLSGTDAHVGTSGDKINEREPFNTE